MMSDVQQWLDSRHEFWLDMLGNESAGQTAQRFGGQYAVARRRAAINVQYAAPWIWTAAPAIAHVDVRELANGTGIPVAARQSCWAIRMPSGPR